jgi:two-component system, OmpR family, alkaline phosphatase synthesis response regulator PhoP
MNQKNIKILLVDDEPDILDFLSYNLKKEGFDVFTAENGLKAIEIATKIQPDLIVLDVMMPQLDGVETCRRLRAMPDFKQTVIIFLTARDEDFTQVAALDVGGDDYISKPLKPRVFISRINAFLRRIDNNNTNSDKNEENLIVFGDLTVDKDKISVIKNNVQIPLAKKEFELLCLLLSRPGKVYTRTEIFHKIWGNDVIVGDRTIDVHIRKLREKIGEEYIGTIKGIGYKIEG